MSYGLFCGKGRLCFSNGDEYTGEFTHCKMNGSGCLVFSNGDVYEGKYVEGQRAGNGIMKVKRYRLYSIDCGVHISLHSLTLCSTPMEMFTKAVGMAQRMAREPTTTLMVVDLKVRKSKFDRLN